MVYQDRFETTLLQQFAHPATSEWFSIISVGIFEVIIVAGTETSIIGNDFLFFVSLHCPQLFYFPPALPLSRRPWARTLS